jgi:hypothetical protein
MKNAIKKPQERSYKMKKNFLPIAVMLISLLVLSNHSWSACPEAPMDLGICDTLYVEQWAHTDTCFDGDCSTPGHKINNPGSAFPCFLYISLFVTHDSNTFYWGGGGKWVQDSIATFVLPFSFWHQTEGGGGNLIFPTDRVRPDINPLMKWNNTVMSEGASQNRFAYSIFRHIVDENGDTIYNRFAQMDYEGWTDWTCNRDIDTLSSDGDSGHVFTSLVPMAADCERWWEGSRVLVATYTFKVSDSMHVYLDSTLWPPTGQLSFIRYDAGTYIPRHELPLAIWIGPPQIEVTSPNGGEVWLVGENHDITWTSEDFSDPVKIEYSTDGGGGWNTIVASTANDGVYPWTIPNAPSTECRVRVSDAADGVPSDMSDSNFTIAGEGITVTSPNGGDSLAIGSSTDITWTWEGSFSDVKIELSRDGGSSWATLIASTPNNGSWTWSSVTGPASATCRVRISDAADGVPADTSDSNFTIYQETITVTHPNGGDSLAIGGSTNITWTWLGSFTSVSIELSRDGGSTWDTLINNTPNDGSWTWTPVTGPASNTCRVRICDTDGSPCDTSNSNFSIVSPDFTIEVKPETLTVVRGDSGEYQMILTSQSGFDGVCVLSVQNLPGGAIGTFDPPQIDFSVVDMDTSILTVAIPDTLTPDTFTLTITATEDKEIQHSQEVVLIVPVPDFTIEVLPETLEVKPNIPDSFQVNLTSLYGFTSSCSLSVAGLDTVGTGVFHPDTLTPTGTSFLVIHDTSTQSRVYPITITATEMVGGKSVLVQHEKKVYLRVLSRCNFKVETFPDTQTVIQGNNTTFDVWIVANVQTDAPCTLSVFNLPPGATGGFDDSVINNLYVDTSTLTIATADTTPEGEYTIFIAARLEQCMDTAKVTLVVQRQTGVDEEEGDQPNAPDKFALFQNQPNPFNPETNISYYLSEGCEVKLVIYNVLGRRVKTLFEGYQNAGTKTLTWDGKDDQGRQSSSGIYFYRLQAGEFSQTRKMNLIR